MVELSYKQWLRKGYVVRHGERAARFRQPAADKAGVGLFTDEQVVPIEMGALPEDEWQVVVDRDKRALPRGKQPTRKPVKTVKIKYIDHKLCVYFGNRPDLIALMRERKFRFQPPVHGGPCAGRWWKIVTPDQVDVAIQAFEQRGYKVVREDKPDGDF